MRFFLISVFLCAIHLQYQQLILAQQESGQDGTSDTSTKTNANLRVESLQSKLEILSKENGELLKKNMEYSNYLEGAQSEVNSLKENLANMESLGSANNVLTKDNNELRLSLAQMSEEKSALESSIVLMKNKNQEDKSSLDRARAEIGSMKDQVTNLEEEKSKVTAELARLQKEQSDGRLEIATQLNLLKETEDRAQKMQQAANDCASRIIDLEAKAQELQETLKNKTASTQKLVMDLRTSGDAMTKAVKESKLLKDRYAVTAKRVEEQQAMIKSLQQQHDGCLTQRDEQENTILALQRHLNRSPFRFLHNTVLRLFAWLKRSVSWSSTKRGVGVQH